MIKVRSNVRVTGSALIRVRFINVRSFDLPTAWQGSC
jgi:hypothetical protein